MELKLLPTPTGPWWQHAEGVEWSSYRDRAPWLVLGVQAVRRGSRQCHCLGGRPACNGGGDNRGGGPTYRRGGPEEQRFIRHKVHRALRDGALETRRVEDNGRRGPQVVGRCEVERQLVVVAVCWFSPFQQFCFCKYEQVGCGLYISSPKGALIKVAQWRSSGRRKYCHLKWLIAWHRSFERNGWQGLQRSESDCVRESVFSGQILCEEKGSSTKIGWDPSGRHHQWHHCSPHHYGIR